MIRALALALAVASPAAAGTLLFEAPGEDPGAPALAIYPAGAPEAAAIALAEPGQAVELAAGGYVYGIGSYPWRSPPVEVPDQGAVALPLGTLRLTAPEGAEARFGLFADDGTRLLLAPLVPGQAVHLPAGPYLLRRDLGEVPRQLRIGAGEELVLQLGGLTVLGPGEAAGAVTYLAGAEGDGGIVAAMPGLAGTLALFEGEYRLAAVAGTAPGPVAPPVSPPVPVVAGQVAERPATLLDWADLADAPGPVGLDLDGRRIELPAGGQARLVLFGAGPVRLALAEGAARDLPLAAGGQARLWRLADGRLPALEGLPLALADDRPQVAAPGLTAELMSELAQAAWVELALRQGETLHPLGQRQAGPGVVRLRVDVPQGLDPDAPVRFEIAVPGALPMTGQTAPVPVHRALAAGPEALAATGTATAVTLDWTLPRPEGVTAIAVFRNADPRPVAQLPPEATTFADIGLSAGRRYGYRVCAVDLLGLTGPCAETEAETPGR